jgi:hypothetical protein
MIDDPITIEEQYERATHSSDLRARAGGRTDVDALIAAGLLAGGGADRATAVSLYRCCATKDLSDMPAILTACEKWLAIRGVQRRRAIPQARRLEIAGKVIGWWIYSRDVVDMPQDDEEHSAWLIAKLDRLSADLHDDLCRLLSAKVRAL